MKKLESRKLCAWFFLESTVKPLNYATNFWARQNYSQNKQNESYANLLFTRVSKKFPAFDFLSTILLVTYDDIYLIRKLDLCGT